MKETKVLTFRVGSEQIPAKSGDATALDVNMYLPKTVATIGEGWEPLSHTLSCVDGDVLLSILVTRDTTAPETVPESLI